MLLEQKYERNDFDCDIESLIRIPYFNYWQYDCKEYEYSTKKYFLNI